MDMAEEEEFERKMKGVGRGLKRERVYETGFGGRTERKRGENE